MQYKDDHLYIFYLIATKISTTITLLNIYPLAITQKQKEIQSKQAA